MNFIVTTTFSLVYNYYHYIRSPSHEALHMIYSSILSQHLRNPVHKFNSNVIKSTDLIVELAINCHTKIQTTFLPTAIKFHYIFNLRDMSNVFQVKLCSMELLLNE